MKNKYDHIPRRQRDRQPKPLVDAISKMKLDMKLKREKREGK